MKVAPAMTWLFVRRYPSPVYEKTGAGLQRLPVLVVDHGMIN
jgi:hypothetical protein